MESWRGVFSEYEVSEFKKKIAEWDKNGDSSIQTTDLGNALRALGHEETEDGIKQLSANLDNGKGMVEFERLLNILVQVKKGDERRGEWFFRLEDMDKEGNGYVPTADLSHALKQMEDSLTSDQIDTMISKADPDKTGQIKYEEFISNFL